MIDRRFIVALHEEAFTSRLSCDKGRRIYTQSIVLLNHGWYFRSPSFKSINCKNLNGRIGSVVLFF